MTSLCYTEQNVIDEKKKIYRTSLYKTNIRKEVKTNEPSITKITTSFMFSSVH